MVLEYFSLKKGKKAQGADKEEATSPVLREDDEEFLRRITSEQVPDPTTALVVLDKDKATTGKDAQEALMDGANQIPLPLSPPAVDESKGSSAAKAAPVKRNYWNYLQAKVPQLPSLKSSDNAKQQAGSSLQDIANAVKDGESLAPPVKIVTAEEAEQEKQDLTSILDRLNLEAVNNRAFSFSTESQKLMAEFTQILKDLINGVPTAYDDLEKLLTRSNSQLQGMFDGLPPFLQKFVKSLPAKLTGTIAPGLLAAASEKPGADAIAAEGSSSGKKRAKRMVPPLKKLLAEQGAITGLLRSILNFLKLRFPAALAGTNVLLSLAAFLLLFVFWYCHKRGKEVRLEKEKLATGQNLSDESVSASDLDDSVLLEKPDPDVARAEAILNQPPGTSQTH